jgi:hypothetical protein
MQSLHQPYIEKFKETEVDQFEFWTNTLTTEEINLKDKCFVFHKTPKRLTQNIHISGSIFIPEGYTRHLKWQLVNERYLINTPAFELLRTSNKNVVKCFLWGLNIHNKPIYVESNSDEVIIYCRGLYKVEKEKKGGCYLNLLSEKQHAIDKLLISQPKMTRDEKKELKRKKSDGDILGPCYVMVFGMNHPSNHVQQSYFTGAMPCYSVNVFRKYSSYGLYKVSVIVGNLMRNLHLNRFVGVVPVKFTVEDFENDCCFNINHLIDRAMEHTREFLIKNT